MRGEQILSRRGPSGSTGIKRSYHSIRQGHTKLLLQAAGKREKPVYLYVHAQGKRSSFKMVSNQRALASAQSKSPGASLNTEQAKDRWGPK